MRNAGIFLTVAAAAVWGFLAVSNIRVALALTNYGHSFGEYWFFVGLPFAGLGITLLSWAARRRWLVASLALGAVSLAVGLFVAVIEGSSRAG